MRHALPEALGRPVVIGVGNPWRRDDGAGPAVAHALGGSATDDPVRLVELWEGASWAVVIDAAQASPPGAIVHFDAAAGPLPAGLARSSTHAFGLAETIELARTLDRLPARLDVYAVAGADFGPGLGLT